MIKKEFSLFLVFLLSFISLFPLVNSDVISVNAGGSNEFVVTSNQYIEGFFSCVPYSCSQLGYSCGDWDDGCSGTINCGTCSSGFICNAGVCVAEDSGGGGGGGGGETPSISIEVSPSEFNINMVTNTNVNRIINVTNTGSNPITISISQTNLDSLAILNETSLNLGIGETRSIEVTFVAPEETGIYTGIIRVGGKPIPVALNVKLELLLFDTNIVVLNDDYQVQQGNELRTQVTLIPMGADPRLDVTLNYEIRDYRGNVYLTRSESVLVVQQMDFRRDFGTGNLPLGSYIIGLELVYPNGVAPSSAHFEVIEKIPLDITGTIIFWLIIAILILVILITAVLITRYLRKRSLQKKMQTQE